MQCAWNVMISHYIIVFGSVFYVMFCCMHWYHLIYDFSCFLKVRRSQQNTETCVWTMMLSKLSTFIFKFICKQRFSRINISTHTKYVFWTGICIRKCFNTWKCTQAIIKLNSQTQRQCFWESAVVSESVNVRHFHVYKLNCCLASEVWLLDCIRHVLYKTHQTGIFVSWSEWGTALENLTFTSDYWVAEAWDQREEEYLTSACFQCCFLVS